MPDTNIRVLVSEDNDVLRQDFCEMIEDSPDMVLAGAASTGAEAVKLALERDVDIILMDIEMEKYHDGIEAANAIAEHKPDVGVIFLTVHEDDETVYRAYSIPTAKDYIVKSAEHADILQRIKDIYDEMQGAPASIASKIQTEFSRLKQTENSLLFFVNILSQITQAEKEIIGLLLDKRKIEEIARIRRVEPVTIKSQIGTLLKKFNRRRTKDIVQLIDRLNLRFLFRTDKEES